jgi:hypothetical protein
MINSEEKNQAEIDRIKNDPIQQNIEHLEYPPSEDIYNRQEKLEDIDPEGISGEKVIIVQNDHEWKQNSDKIGNDLDIPGSELDDEQEEIGSEDEENNFYSQGDTE